MYQQNKIGRPLIRWDEKDIVEKMKIDKIKERNNNLEEQFKGARAFNDY